MIIPEQRQSIMMWITEATQAGARQQQACHLIGLSTRTLQRWQKAIEQVDGRTRRTAPPPHKLSPGERAKLLEITSSAQFAHLPPSQIVPMLADEGLYFASESTFYRVLRDARQNHVLSLGHSVPPRPISSTVGISLISPAVLKASIFTSTFSSIFLAVRLSVGRYMLKKVPSMPVI